ncbi:MAG: Plasma membrane t-SNARE, secretory vesicle fusion [Phylliscum demangeonii]|nr:MAG: Plasma membrane t-SNARE, secretory vesicle fusion [Phylliscum demangeonii]
MLNEIREIDRGIDAIERNLERLRMVQQQSLGDPNSSQDSPINRERDRLSEDTMTLYRNFVIRMRTIKSQPESGNPTNASQVGRVDRRLKGAIQQFQTLDSDYRKKLQQQVERELRIVRPDATESEIREAVEDTSNNQVFTQALLQSDRRGQSQRVLQHVTSRHEAIQKIEVQFVELAQLFQDMEALVVQQEPAVTQIEQKGEQVTEDVGKANVEISGAIQKARSRNRKKWWCLLIVLFAVGDAMAQQGVEQVGPKKHDFARTGRMALYGGTVMGPAATIWFRFLQRRVRLPNRNAEIVARVVADQAIFGPTILVAFLTSMSLMEGSDPADKLKKTYKQALLKGWSIWPVVQLVNFKFVPLEHRLLVVNVFALGWNCYLSLLNSSARR